MKKKHYHSICVVLVLSLVLVCCSFSMVFAGSNIFFSDLVEGNIYSGKTVLSVKNPVADHQYGCVFMPEGSNKNDLSYASLGRLTAGPISSHDYVQLKKYYTYNNVGMVSLANGDTYLRCVVLTAAFNENTATGTLLYPMDGEMHQTTFTSSRVVNGKAYSVQITALDNKVYQAVYDADYLSADTMNFDVYYLFWGKAMINIMLPTQQGFSIVPTEGSESTFEAGADYSFSVKLADGYEKSPKFVVKSNGVALTEKDGLYTVKTPLEDQTITVEGVVLASASTDTDNPDTGDSSQVGIWVALLAGALVLSGGLGVFVQRKRAK